MAIMRNPFFFASSVVNSRLVRCASDMLTRYRALLIANWTERKLAKSFSGPMSSKLAACSGFYLYMMTSSNGNIFRVYCSFVRGIHRRPVNSPHKGQWREALMFSLIFPWTNGWVDNRDAGDLRRHGAHYSVIVMSQKYTCEHIRSKKKINVTFVCWV